MSKKSIRTGRMFTGNAKKLKIQCGFSLVEVMMASALSLLILSILFSVYISVQRSSQIQNALSLLENNGKLATTMLKTEIHKAGNMGCLRLTADFPITDYLPYTITAQNKLTGTGDAFTVRYAETPNDMLVQSMQEMNVLYTNQDVLFMPNDILIISDCRHAEIFKIHKINRFHGMQKITTTFPLHNRFSKLAEISRLVINKYIIKRTNHPDGGLPYSLFVENIFHHQTELVGGINKMFILYSVLINGKIIDLQATDISDWSKVMGVAIKLELISRSFKKNWYIYASVMN